MRIRDRSRWEEEVRHFRSIGQPEVTRAAKELADRAEQLVDEGRVFQTAMRQAWQERVVGYASMPVREAMPLLHSQYKALSILADCWGYGPSVMEWFRDKVRENCFECAVRYQKVNFFEGMPFRPYLKREEESDGSN